MVFSSVTFLFYFLPIFLALYFLLGFPKTILLVASLAFYAWGEPQNLPLLIVCIAGNYTFGRLIGAAQARGHTGIAACAVGIAFNLGGLAYFKYANFAVASVNGVAGAMGFATEKMAAVALPLGISFFTFHAISYLMDVYRKKAKAEKNIFALATYIAMFPQLVAGPIVRFSSVAKQLDHRRTTLWRVEVGARLFIVGLAQKVLIANTVALPADQIFSLGAGALGSATAWLGIVCYTLQIYFDFSGYSNMAIGLGLITGFTFPRNFNYPYVSQSVTEFWRRWHMSLSRWFRDYLYIPLGGNRGAPARTSFNLLCVFLLCGLWHGASWTFVLWGLYHGLFLVVERAGLLRILAGLPSVVRHAYLLLVVMVGWVFFRCDSLMHAVFYLKAMAGFSSSESSAAAPFTGYVSTSVMMAIVIGLLVSAPILTMITNAVVAKNGSLHAQGSALRQSPVRLMASVWSLLMFSFSMMSLASGAYNPFIYFRF